MKRVLRWIVLAVIAFVVSGCASARDRAVMAMNGTATFADGAHDHVADEYQQALKDCVKFADTKPKALSCGKDVDDKFDPLWKAYRVVRATWLMMAATVHAAELEGGELSEDEALKLLAELSAAVSAFREALKKGTP